MSLGSIGQMLLSKWGAKEFANLWGFLEFAVKVSEASKEPAVEPGDYVIVPSVGIQYQMTIVLDKDGELKFTDMCFND